MTIIFFGEMRVPGVSRASVDTNAGRLTACVSQWRPAHSEIYWQALIKHRGGERDASSHLRRTFYPKGGMTTRLSYLHETEQHFDSTTPLHKCLLTVRHEEAGDRLFNAREWIVWSDFTA
ncbi:hypothetical protein NQZ68_036141 [Dissostichus eleginoides]|nr:hypothetical protein NQZ68_036141 [Dissostichus eleginoides]